MGAMDSLPDPKSFGSERDRHAAVDGDAKGGALKWMNVRCTSKLASIASGGKSSVACGDGVASRREQQCSLAGSLAGSDSIAGTTL